MEKFKGRLHEMAATQSKPDPAAATITSVDSGAFLDDIKKKYATQGRQSGKIQFDQSFDVTSSEWPGGQ